MDLEDIRVTPGKVEQSDQNSESSSSLIGRLEDFRLLEEGSDELEEVFVPSPDLPTPPMTPQPSTASRALAAARVSILTPKTSSSPSAFTSPAKFTSPQATRSGALPHVLAPPQTPRPRFRYKRKRGITSPSHAPPNELENVLFSALESRATFKVIFGPPVGYGSSFQVFSGTLRVFTPDSDAYTDISVAIKKSLRPLRGLADRGHRVEELSLACRTAPHPNIAHYYLAWHESGNFYVAMQRYACNARVFFFDRQRSPGFVWRLAADLSRALARVHELGIVHLDVKLENILVEEKAPTSPDGRLDEAGSASFVLSDFGEAGFSSELSKRADLDGDARFLAAELLDRNEGDPISAAVDMFSFGMSLMAAAARWNPPSCNDDWHRLRSPESSESFLCELMGRAGVEDELQRLVLGLMKPDPASRLSAQECLDMVRRSAWGRTHLVE